MIEVPEGEVPEGIAEEVVAAPTDAVPAPPDAGLTRAPMRLAESRCCQTLGNHLQSRLPNTASLISLSGVGVHTVSEERRRGTFTRSNQTRHIAKECQLCRLTMDLLVR